VPLGKNEGVVKRHLCAAILFRTASTSELVDNRSSANLTVNHFQVNFLPPTIALAYCIGRNSKGMNEATKLEARSKTLPAQNPRFLNARIH